MRSGRPSNLVLRACYEVGAFAVLLVGSFLAKLVPFAVVVGCLAAFAVGIHLLRFLLGPFGVSDRAIAAAVGASVIVGFWVVGLKLLTDW